MNAFIILHFGDFFYYMPIFIVFFRKNELEEKMERWMYLEDLAARIERGEEN